MKNTGLLKGSFISPLLLLVVLASGIDAQQRCPSPDRHIKEPRSVRILTKPQSVNIFDEYGNYLGRTPNITIPCVHHEMRIFFTVSREREKARKEMQEGAPAGYEDNYKIIEKGYFAGENTYPKDGKPIVLVKKGARQKWFVGAGAFSLAVLGALFLILRALRKKMLQIAALKASEPSTVTQSDLEGFGGQVGDIRGKRLVGRFGTYVVKEIMGEGGMSIVYDAVRESDEKGGREEHCAVKVVLPAMARTEEFNKRFHREIEVYHRMAHPSIVQIYDWGDEEGVLFIVMEKIEGKPLSEVMKQGKPEMKKALVWCLQILKALGYAHYHKVVHRDIKPSNIFITLGENIKVLDFGIARALDAKTITASDSALGTPQYLPPEQLDSRSVDGRADLYSLGVLLYQLLSGSLPFEGKTTYEILMKQMTEPPPPLSTINANVPREVELVVMKLLEKKPENRYSTARDAALFLGTAAVQAGLLSEEELGRMLQ
ncbi:MAG: serine/threonine-protein kinase [Candidatus Eremiobacteraeota bacterium]|nr:serine/threonine-protein kinase [Candidatus Eremiobacteraeota bacterium]